MGGENSSSRGLRNSNTIQTGSEELTVKLQGEKKGRDSQNEIPTTQQH